MPVFRWMAVAIVMIQVGAALGADANSAAKSVAVLAASAIRNKVDGDWPELRAIYEDLHRNPELSHNEVRTAGRLAAAMRKEGFEVAERFGGNGVVAILKNGPGPVVMIRTDLDALPVVEKTGLPYASTIETRDPEGNRVGVMHACGHDVHMTCWVGTAKALSALRDRWSGTLVFVGQPAEERGSGARDMLAAGLFEKFPKPDFALCVHCEPFTPHGSVGFTEGLAMANVDSVDIRIVGKGGHGAAPHTTIDPIVIAARIVLDLQTLVSRELDPLDSGVVTVGSIHAGTKHNIIPPDARLQITVRSLKDSTRKHLLEGIERIAKAAAAAARAPEPEVKIDPAEYTPALSNDPALVRRVLPVFREVLGEEKVLPLAPVMGGEDFSRYGRAGVPSFLIRLGTQPPEKVQAARSGGAPLASLHSDRFAPVAEPTIKTGILALSTAVLQLAGKDDAAAPQ